MSISNNPLHHTAPVHTPAPPPPERVVTSPPPPPPPPPPSRSSFAPRLAPPGPSALPDSGQVQLAEARIDATPPARIQAQARVVPPPLGLRVITSRAVMTDAPPATTRSFTRSEFGKQLIGPQFAGLSNELHDTWFFKGAVHKRATARAEQMIRNLPPDSDLMHTLLSTPQAELREMVAHGIAQTRPDKYDDQTTYAQLSPNKQKLVDSILAGMLQGMPADLRAARQASSATGVDVDQVHQHSHLTTEIQRVGLRGPSAETLARLDAMSNRGIEHARTEIRGAHEALRTQLTYEHLPVPDPATVSIGVLGDGAIRALAPANEGLSARAEALINTYAGADKQQLMWSVAMQPFNQLADSVGARLYPGVDPRSAEQQEVTGKVALSLLQASMKQLGSAAGNTLESSDRHGNPTTVQVKGKTFEQVRQLGEGGFGRAFLFRAADGEEVVVKKFMRQDMSEESWFRNMQTEIRAHRYAMGPEGTGHENMLNLHGVVVRPPGEGESFGEFFTVTEAAKGGEMRDLMGTMHHQLQEKRISRTVYDLLNRQLFAQTIEGMHFVQRDRQMLHLDLKPENIFMTSDGRVKVADFGLAHIGHERRGAGGTGNYMAPEVASGHHPDDAQRVRRDVDYHADTWTLGVIGRELFSGERALPGARQVMDFDGGGFGMQLSDPIEDTVAFGSDTGNRIFRSGEGHDLQALGGYHQLINAMMNPDPSQRPTLDAVRDHHFVSDPILQAPQLQTLLEKLLVSTKNMSSSEKKAHYAEIARLNTEIEGLARH